MKRFTTLLYKDYLLLIRDVAGLCLMFVMPVALVFLMTFLQNDIIGRINESEISVVMLNKDNDVLGNSIEKQIDSSESFILTKTEYNEDELRLAVARGDYMVGIVVPQDVSEAVRQNAKYAVQRGFMEEELEDSIVPVVIQIYIDPTIRASFRNTLINAMNEYAAKTERDFLLHELLSTFSRIVPFMPNIQLDANQVYFDVQYALKHEKTIIPNAAQHNVPAWTLFAIFFITLPLSVNLINQRKDGSFTRLLTMPCSYFQYLLSISIVFLMICLLQFSLIFALGMYLFPQIGLPQLMLGTNAWLLLPMCICSSFAAIGFGILVGKITTDHQQAVVLSALSVVIFAAVGGIWVPVFAMPEIMKTISQISPINWGLNGFYDILIRNGTFIDVLPKCLYSFCFAFICVVVALLYHSKKSDVILS